jgi:hypothetical protein
MYRSACIRSRVSKLNVLKVVNPPHRPTPSNARQPGRFAQATITMPSTNEPRTLIANVYQCPGSQRPIPYRKTAPQPPPRKTESGYNQLFTGDLGFEFLLSLAAVEGWRVLFPGARGSAARCLEPRWVEFFWRPGITRASADTVCPKNYRNRAFEMGMVQQPDLDQASESCPD